MSGRKPSDSHDAPDRAPDRPGAAAIVLPNDDVDAWCAALQRLAARADAEPASRGHLWLPSADPDGARAAIVARIEARERIAVDAGRSGRRMIRWLCRMRDGWPPALPGLHRIELEAGRWLVTVAHAPAPGAPDHVRSRRRSSGRTGSAGGFQTAFRPSRVRDVLVVGAGLAGCAVADALLRRGFTVTVVEASDASGGVVAGLPWLAQHPDIAPDRRSRLLVQAMLMTARLGDRLSPAFVRCGRLQPMPAALAGRLARGWPQAVVSVREGSHDGADGPDGPGGLWFPSAAVADPQAWWHGLAARDDLQPRTGVRIDRLVRGDRWQALDTEGRAVASADAVVLTNAGDAFRLADMPPVATGRLRERRIAVRIGAAIAADGMAVKPGATRRLLPVRGGDGDRRPFRIEEPGVSCVLGAAAGEAMAWPGVTVSWRCFDGGPRLQLRDNLPMAGPVPDCAAVLADRDRYERDARIPLPAVDGLHLLAGLGGRGLLWSVIGAERIAADIAGEPSPLESDLCEAISPDRFLVRTLRRTPRGRGALPLALEADPAAR